jgi:uncharacterized protein YdiU (UPF0061 family)
MFSNRYQTFPERFYERVQPEKFDSPQLIAFNHELANELDPLLNQFPEDELAQIFSGQKILEGSEPLALAYSGYQFGHFNPHLGDGRAHLLGQINGHDIQLKGSGRTSFSRRGDGRSALGPVLREYIVSEAMHAFGIPTTRALAAVKTNENVYRQFGEEPGGIFTRVASSHLRVGTFQYFAARQDKEALALLLDFAIDLHYPYLKESKEKALFLLIELTKRQSELIAKWTQVGFIHGVMNTDNFSVAGITIDYGPCAFMDEFNYDKVFSSIDRHGRYRFFNQLPIARWNILRLADCLLPFIHEEEDQAIKRVEEALTPEFEKMETLRMSHLAMKMGISNYEKSDQNLVKKFLDHLQENGLDFTLSFSEIDSFYENKQLSFSSEWRERVNNLSGLEKINPLYIPRNHQIEKVIDEAYQGDYKRFHEINEVLKKPFLKNEKLDFFRESPRTEEKVKETFCGT